MCIKQQAVTTFSGGCAYSEDPLQVEMIFSYTSVSSQLFLATSPWTHHEERTDWSKCISKNIFIRSHFEVIMKSA